MKKNEEKPVVIEMVKTEIDMEPRRLPEGVKFYNGTEVKDKEMGFNLNSQKDVAVGDKVVVEDCWGDKVIATVTKVDGKKAVARRGSRCSYSLEFGNDDRKCWACTSTNMIDLACGFDLDTELEVSNG